ncbi:transcription termination factor NusA [Loigolactobacillus bifermentans]|uniref:Transcription termination/antitermination protein NusA n=1 Tax=Loigolactobacillus bifermentans DSM 20003 TaxID=1423726 RepID=A0A0R1GQS5_9LACO|nr:transcription termination factor NusA [Loigolactobacillus bifermentans]KRK34177.1 transcription elongation factor NusA [Loigolactobacillus bifermentans DSM 20003]QGG59294.1 transcription termination/antitermination protein NusA [Loigolactobacillus bifermentans]
MNKEMLSALDALEKEKGVKKEVVVEAMEAALVSAYKRNYGQAQNVEVDFDEKTGNIHIYAVKEVTEEVFDSRLEVALKEALTINEAYEIGDEIRFEVTPKDFGRIAAQTAKQVILQRVREAERNIIYDQYIKYENEIMQGVVERRDSRYIYVNLGKIEAILSRNDQMPNEHYEPHDRIKVFVTKVENTPKGPQVHVSRTHPDLVKRLFEQEVPEIFDGTVEIVSISREAGDRTKMAVRSTDANVDPVGTCVGPRGQRVQAVVNELAGENMDIIEWVDDPAVYIANALNPAQVVDVWFDDENDKAATVIVPDYQLSLAIGKRGQNARLAAKLTGFKIDIKSESEAEEAAVQAPAATATADDTTAAPEASEAAPTAETAEVPTTDQATSDGTDEQAD